MRSGALGAASAAALKAGAWPHDLGGGAHSTLHLHLFDADPSVAGCDHNPSPARVAD